MIRLVVKDSTKARAWLVQQVAADRVVGKIRRGATESDAVLTVADELGIQEPPVGALYGESDLECPMGEPNCRNCGDFAYSDQCRAAGHCTQCGVLHGTAPDSVLEAHGLRIE
jgi:hypothetical protein